MDAEHRAGELVHSAAIFDPAGVEYAVEAIKPAIGPPGERVRKFMRIGAAKACDNHFALVGPTVAIGILQEEYVWCVRYPDTTGANGDTRRYVQTLGKDRDFVDPPVVVDVFKHFNTVATRTGRVAWVFEAFGQPNAAPFVECHRHGVHEVGFGGDDFDLKTGRDRHACRSFGGRKRLVRRPVVTARKHRLFGFGGLRDGCRVIRVDPDQKQQTKTKHESRCSGR